jgi:hypothetical protein
MSRAGHVERSIQGLQDIPKDADIDTRINACTLLAWEQYEIAARHPVERVPTLIEGPFEFGASVGERLERDGVQLIIDRASVTRLDEVWKDILALNDLWSGNDDHPAPDAFEWANHSLFWMILHEIGHVDRRHLDIILDRKVGFRDGRINASRLGLMPAAGRLAERAGHTEPDVYKIMELHADDLAIQCALFFYHPEMSGEDLIDLRGVSLAALTVMILVDQEQSGEPDRGGRVFYPSPAARVYQLLARTMLRPYEYLKPAYIDGKKRDRTSTAPEDSMYLEEYRGIVFAPLVSHLESVCAALGGDGYYERTGLDGNMIEDVTRWMQAIDLNSAGLESKGAIECAQLEPLNTVLEDFLRQTARSQD